MAAVILSACTAIETGSEAEDLVYEQEGIQMPLSISVGARSTVTKMTAAVTQADQTESSFRGIKQIYAIPFKVKRSVVSTDERLGENLKLPQKGIPKSFGTSALNGDFSGLVSNNNSHLYKVVIIPRGTASMLVYGQAIDENVSVATDSVAFKRRNGVLQKHGVESAEPADINFTLEPFITAEAASTFNSTVSEQYYHRFGIADGLYQVRRDFFLIHSAHLDLYMEDSGKLQ